MPDNGEVCTVALERNENLADAGMGLAGILNG